MTNDSALNDSIKQNEPYYRKVLNYFIETFKPTSDYIIVFIAHQNFIKIISLIKKESHYKIIYIYETNEPINENILNNFENFEAFLLIEQNYEESLIPDELLKKVKIHKFGSAVSSSTADLIKFRRFYETYSLQTFPPPAFEYFLRDVSNFEAILYYILNTVTVFMGEAIQIVFADNPIIVSYHFRRMLYNFIFKQKMNIRKFRADFLPVSNLVHVIIIKDTNEQNFIINEIYTIIKMSPENIKKGLEYYEKAEEEQALSISGTPDYINLLEEEVNEDVTSELPQVKGQPKEEKVSISVISSQTDSLNKNKNVYIEIKEDAFRIRITAKTKTKLNLIFGYPSNGNFIPMYISFVREIAIIGKQAIEDYKGHPEFVIFDIINILGRPNYDPPEFNQKWGFQLVPVSASHDAKFGFKIKTFDGIKVFPVEIALAILFKYLLNIASKHSQIKNIDLRFLKRKLSTSQKAALRDIGRILNISINVESNL